MKKNLTKKLMLSVLTLAFAVVSLGASTFAWFTTSKEASVEQIEANVIGGSGIEIAVGAAGATAPSSAYFVNQLPLEQITNVLNGYGFTELDHLSGIKTGSLTEFNGSLYDIEEKTATKGYVAFRLFVRVNNKGDITLNTINLGSTSPETTWKSGIAYQIGADNAETTDVVENQIGADQVVKYSVLDALRVAVIASESDGSNSVTKVYERAATSVNTKGFSKYGAYDIYNKKMENGTPLTLFNVESNLTTANTNWANSEFAEGKEGEVGKETFKQLTDKITFADVEKDDFIAFDVYMWVEGYDQECVNAIFSQNVQLNLEFGWSE